MSMISQLSIDNFAIIQHLEVTFHDGLNIMTGETGAGKSIIIEAVSLALGARSDTAFVRTGCERALIQLVLTDPSWEEPVILTREIFAKGKSLCRINDRIVTRASLSEFSRRFVDIHGQYDHQSLLDPQMHLSILDACAREQIGPLKEETARLFALYEKSQAELSALKKKKSELLQKRSFLEFKRDEISRIDPRPGEDQNLEQALSLMKNSGAVYQALSLSYENLYNREDSVSDLLGSLMGQLSQVEKLSPQIEAFTACASDCYYRLLDLSEQIRRFRDRVEFSPQQIDQTIQRLEDLNQLKAKYGGSIQAVLEYYANLEGALEDAEDLDERILSQETHTQELAVALSQSCAGLSLRRKQAAESIEKAINRELSQLNFQNAHFSVSFQENRDSHGQAVFTSQGLDVVEFMISTNKGEALKPLGKIASGGEISRIMLAFKRILGDYDRIPTMIFDEIDSGISGQAAAVVGKKLAQIGKNHQVICITHLAQIAAMGEHHYKIFKSSDETQTYTEIQPLSGKDLIQEIARLSGSLALTEGALRNAEEMLELAKKAKES